jgi:hypothetical protein
MQTLDKNVVCRMQWSFVVCRMQWSCCLSNAMVVLSAECNGHLLCIERVNWYYCHLPDKTSIVVIMLLLFVKQHVEYVVCSYFLN